VLQALRDSATAVPDLKITTGWAGQQTKEGVRVYTMQGVRGSQERFKKRRSGRGMLQTSLWRIQQVS
jgi:hypothetical protein